MMATRSRERRPWKPGASDLVEETQWKMTSDP
jgi:hypothetical protein